MTIRLSILAEAWLQASVRIDATTRTTGATTPTRKARQRSAESIPDDPGGSLPCSRLIRSFADADRPRIDRLPRGGARRRFKHLTIRPDDDSLDLGPQVRARIEQDILIGMAGPAAEAHHRGKSNRPQLKLRAFMFAVAVIAVPLACWAQISARRVRLLAIAAEHRKQVVAQVLVGFGQPGTDAVLHSTPYSRPVGPAEVERSLWHLGIARRYEAGARHFWPHVSPRPGGRW